MDPEMLRDLLHISRRMAETRTLDSLLAYAMKEVLGFVGAERGYLILVNADGTLNFRVRCDRVGQEIEQPEEQISHTILNDVIGKRESRVIADAIGANDLQYAQSVVDLQLRSIMCVPLVSREAKLGAIYVENRSERDLFNENDLEPLELFASQAAICIENAMLNDDLETQVAARTSELARANGRLRQEIEERKRAQEELRWLATRDPLTSVFNRRQFFELGQREFERSQRYDRPLAVVLMDLDHFKRVNDTYGHLAGDQMLITVAEICQDNIREVDILARYGGEEFVLLLPETRIAQARHTAERLRQEVAGTSVEAEGHRVSVTMSLGVAGRDDDEHETLGKMLHRADQALYAAKKAGRNRVMVWQDSLKH